MGKTLQIVPGKALKILGLIRQGGYVLPEDHGLSPEEIGRLKGMGLLREIDNSTAEAGEPDPEEPVGEPIKHAVKWDHDPSNLEGKSLTQLNLMVRERDKTVDPFETVEEAIAFLSQDL